MGVSARLNRHLQSFGVWSATRSCRQIVNFLVVNFCDQIEYMALAFTRDDGGATVSVVSKNRSAWSANIIHYSCTAQIIGCPKVPTNLTNQVTERLTNTSAKNKKTNTHATLTQASAVAAIELLSAISSASSLRVDGIEQVLKHAR